MEKERWGNGMGDAGGSWLCYIDGVMADDGMFGDPSTLEL